MKVGIFYGSTYGNTSQAAQLLKAKLIGFEGLEVQDFDISATKIEQMLEFDLVLLGSSTWYIGEVQDDWHGKYEDLSKLVWNNKPVALFGSGDQMTYADTFQDALGIIGEELEKGGARLVGFTSVVGYQHTASRGQRGQQFIGLALDDDNEGKLTAARVESWVGQLVTEIGLVV